jgi:hypothetical protein
MTEHFQLFEGGHCRVGKLHRSSEITSGSLSLEPGIPDFSLPWAFSKHELFLMQGTA